MHRPYRWGDVPPPAVAVLKQRRQRRAEAAEFFRLTGGRLRGVAPAGLALARAGWLRKPEQSIEAVDSGWPQQDRDEPESQ